jgi:hypothetical protein
MRFPAGQLAAAREGDRRDGSHVHSRTVRRGRRPAMPLQHRHGYAAGIHRGLPTGDIDRPRSSPTGDALGHADRVARCFQPRSARLELVALLRGVQPLVPHVRLSVSLAGPGPSGGAGPSRRCQGCFRSPPHPRSRAALSFTGPLRRTGRGVLSPPLGSRTPRGARCRRPTAGPGRSR